MENPNSRLSTSDDYQFDAAANVIEDAEGRQFTCDAENKQVKVENGSRQLIGQYYFDGDGKRVKKIAGSEETIFVYSSGKLIAEYSSKPPAQNPTTTFTITDQLGSPRVLVNSLGEVVSRRDFLPFGEEIVPDAANLRTDANLKYNGDGVRQKFTGYQKDEESGLDFAEARMYENRHGRFTAIDPLLASGKSANPQTFNRYVYVMNRPLALTDANGLQAGSPPPDIYRGPVYFTNGQFSRYKEEGSKLYRGKPTYATAAVGNGYQYRVTRNGWTRIGIPAPKPPEAGPSNASSVKITPDTPLSEQISNGVILTKSDVAAAFIMAGLKSLGNYLYYKGEYERFMSDPQIQFGMNASIIGAPLAFEANVAREASLADEALVV